MSGSRRYCLLKMRKIRKNTSAKTDQSAICLDDLFKEIPP
jgi:hypothetical protein